MKMPKRILIPVDFSPESMHALKWTIPLLQNQPDSMIQLCHILPPIIAAAGPGTMGFDPFPYFEIEKKSCEDKLGAIQALIPPSIFSSSVVRQGVIAEEIKRLCEERVIDLVVMTTKGRRGLSRFLHGSTTEETVRVAPCPVLVLHLNAPARGAFEVSSHDCSTAA